MFYMRNCLPVYLAYKWQGTQVWLREIYFTIENKGDMGMF